LGSFKDLSIHRDRLRTATLLYTMLFFHYHQPINVSTARAQAFLMDPYYSVRRTGHNPPRGPSTGWWVLTTANAAGTNGLTCFPKHGGAQINKFLNIHPMSGQRRLTSAIARRSVAAAGPSSSYDILYFHSFVIKLNYFSVTVNKTR
jgi:hypothetical protein